MHLDEHPPLCSSIPLSVDEHHSQTIFRMKNLSKFNTPGDLASHFDRAMSHQRIPAGLIVARRGVVCRISQWIGPPPVHCAACTANNRRGWREGETPVVSFTTRVSTSTRVRHADTGRVQTGTERERRREEEREREGERVHGNLPPMDTYMRVMAHVRPERVRQR